MSDLNTGQLGKYRGVGGWLLLLCFSLTIGSPLKTLFNLMAAYNACYGYFNQFPSLKTLIYIDGFFSCVLMLLSIRAGIALYKIKPNAVKIAKNYFWIYLGYSVIVVFLPFTVGLPSEFNKAMITESVKGAIVSLFYFGIWVGYLNVSKRVKAVYE